MNGTVPEMRMSKETHEVRWRPSLMVGASAVMFSITLTAVLAQGTKPASAASGNAANGKAVYEKAGCATCHGANGTGGSGPRIASTGLDFAQFTKAVRQPTGLMPAVTEQEVSNAQLADIHAFLRAPAPAQTAAGAAKGQVAKAEAAVPATAPPGNVENGKKLYNAASCYACHGYVGQGGGGPKVGPDPVSYPAYIAALRHPRDDMPPYTVKSLSDQQAADIYAYMKTFPQPPNVDSIPLLNVK